MKSISVIIITFFFSSTIFGQIKNDIEFIEGSKIDSIELDNQKIETLNTLGLVWGFLKYHHPNVASGNFNWDFELFRILPQILNAKSTHERDIYLMNWINKLDGYEVEEKEKKIEGVKIYPDLDWITNSNFSTELTDELLKIKKAKRTGSNYYIGLKSRVQNPDFKNEEPYSEMKYPDTGYRLLSLFRYWNIIQYYFPNKHLIEEDWKNVLTEFIPKFVNTKSEIDYKLVTLELIARIHDTHANIWGKEITLTNYWGVNYAPFEITFIEDKAIVTDYFDEKLGLETGLIIGDEITKINGELVTNLVNKRLIHTPASNYPTQLRSLSRKLLRTNDTVFNIEFRREGKTQIKSVKTFSNEKINIYKNYQNRDTCFKFINEEIAYLNLGSIKSKYLRNIFKDIKETKGLIIDLRCYPSEFVVFSLGRYLMPQNTKFVKFTKGSIESPGLFTFTECQSVGQKNKKHYKGKVVILINELTQSQAEYTTMAFRVAPKATVIGSTTAGADGNVSAIYLPGNIRTMISGIGVYYPNGTETQRIGIVPDIEIKPTIEGIKNKKDELLEKAIELINE